MKKTVLLGFLLLMFIPLASANWFCDSGTQRISDSESCDQPCPEGQHCWREAGMCADGSYQCVFFNGGPSGPPSCSGECASRPLGEEFCDADGNRATCVLNDVCPEKDVLETCTGDCETTGYTWAAPTITTGDCDSPSIFPASPSISFQTEGSVCASGSSHSSSGRVSCVFFQTTFDGPCHPGAPSSCMSIVSEACICPVDSSKTASVSQQCTPTGAQCLVAPEGSFTSDAFTCDVASGSGTCSSPSGGVVTFTFNEAVTDPKVYLSSSDGSFIHELSCNINPAQGTGSCELPSWVQHHERSGHPRSIRLGDGSASNVLDTIVANANPLRGAYGVCVPDTGLVWRDDACRCPSGYEWDPDEGSGLCVEEDDGTPSNPNVWFTNQPFSCSLAAGDTTCSAQITYSHNAAAGSAQVRIDTSSGFQIISGCSSGSPCSSPGWIRHPNWLDGGSSPNPSWPRTLEVRSTESPVANAQTTIEAECASGLFWDVTENSCQAPPGPTANLNFPSCEITTAGGTSCEATVSWTTENADPTVRLFRGFVHETSISGFDVELTLNSVNFHLRHGCSSTSWTSCDETLTSVSRSASCGETANGDQLVEEGGACVIGTCGECTPLRVCEGGVVTDISCDYNNCPETDSWSCDYGCNTAGNNCAPAPTGTLTVGSCEIGNKENNCTVSSSWISNNAQNLQLRVNDNIQHSNLPINGDMMVELSYGANVVELYGFDLGGTLREIRYVNRVASCADELIWDEDLDMCVECVAHNDCDGNLVCDPAGQCVDPELTLTVQVDGTTMIQEGSINSCTGAVTASCTVNPSQGLTTSLSISPDCSSAPGDWSCDYGNEYSVTCSLDQRPGVIEELTFTINPEPGSISGSYYYYLADGELADDITIEAELRRSGNVENTLTITDGFYEFETLETGVYSIVSSHPLYDIERIQPAMSCGEQLGRDLIVADKMCYADCTSGDGRCNFDCLGEGGCELFDPDFFEEYAYLLNQDLPLAEHTSADELIDLLILQCEGQLPGARIEILGFPGHYFVCCGSANADTLTPCTDDGDCAGGFVCHDDGYCVPVPEPCDDGDCPIGYECEGGFCTPRDPPHKPNPRDPIQSFDVTPATVASDARHLVQFTRLVSYSGMPVRMNVVVVSE